MHATCPHCRKGFVVADDKIPPGREVAVVCPGCKGRFTLSAPAPPVQPPAPEAPPESGAGPQPREGGSALCCFRDPAAGERMRVILEGMGHRVVRPSSPEEGVDRLRFSPFPMVVYQDGFDPGPKGGVWGHLRSLSGEERRGILAIWVGKGVASGDPMATLAKSADLAVEEGDLDQMPELLAKAHDERQRFYSPLRVVLKEMGVE